MPSFGGDLREVVTGKVHLVLTWLPFRSPGRRDRGPQRRRLGRVAAEAEEGAAAEEDESEEDSDSAESDDGSSQGVLLVTVIQGFDLTRPDTVTSPADVYVSARLDPGGTPGDQHRTATTKGSSNPVFNEHFALFVSAPTAVLRVAAFHFDPGENDVRLGSASIPVDTVLAEQLQNGGSPTERIFELAGVVSCRLRLRLQFLGCNGLAM